MKRVLFILAILLLPLSLMAMTPVSDNEMSNVTGQSGVTIDISAMNISFEMDTVTWGDIDGLVPNWENPYTDGILTGGTGTWRAADSGYINMCFYDLPMHITLSNVRVMFDVGSYAGAYTYAGFFATVPNAPVTTRAIKISLSQVNVQVDGFGFDAIVLDNVAGAIKDYEGGILNDGNPYNAQTDGYKAGSPWTGNGSRTAGGLALNTKSLGAFGFSGMRVSIPAATIYIYAH